MNIPVAQCRHFMTDEERSQEKIRFLEQEAPFATERALTTIMRVYNLTDRIEAMQILQVKRKQVAREYGPTMLESFK